MEPVNDHEKLGRLFELRETQYRTVTDQIYDMVPNVQEALYRLFNLPKDQVEWDDIDIIEEAIVLQVTISYTPNTISPFVQTFAPTDHAPADVESISQMVRVGLPAHMAFASVEEIINFFIAISKKMPPPAEGDVVKSTFDMESLTPEQQQQLLLAHLHTPSGSKH
jgi:hypothetical protein